MIITAPYVFRWKYPIGPHKMNIRNTDRFGFGEATLLYAIKYY